MSDSILITIKKLLGLDADYDAFDTDVIMHINSILMVLAQLGVGPEEGLMITGPEQTWSDLIDPYTDNLQSVITYIYLRVRLLFDPPQTGPLMQAIERQYQELEWRLNVEVDPRR